MACPAVPGWTTTPASSGGGTTGCNYTSPTTPIQRAAAAQFPLTAAVKAGSDSASGGWSVKVDADANGVSGANSATATAEAAGALTTEIYVFEVLDAVVASAATPAGAPCPAPARYALPRSVWTITICGKNHASVGQPA